MVRKQRLAETQTTNQSTEFGVSSSSQCVLDDVVQASSPGQGAIVLGQVVACDPSGAAMVAVPGLGTLKVNQSLIPIQPQLVGKMVALSVLDQRLALLMGVLWAPPAEQVHDAALPSSQGDDHLVVAANRTVELRCGEAAIVLHADGRIQLRGQYITSHADATHRIVGSSVHVN